MIGTKSVPELLFVAAYGDVIAGKAKAFFLDRPFVYMPVDYEDNISLFIGTMMDVDGHMLAIPRKHVKCILDCDAETLNHLMATVKKVSNHCVDACGYDGVNLLNASDESAGQSVPHFHIHIIPRKRGDGIDTWPTFHGANYEIEALFQKLRIR